MKPLLSLAVFMAMVPLMAQPPQVSTNPDQEPEVVSVQSKGLDVRAVLHDLFTQGKKSYVLENIPRIDLYLSLEEADFQEALELILKTTNLKYELQNGIYFISRAPRTAATTPVSTAQPKPAPKQPAKTNPKTGKLSESVMIRSVKGSWKKEKLSEILKDLGEQAEVDIELDAKVPQYSLDFSLNTTSLGWTLKRLAEELNLEIEFTDRQSILLKPKKA